MNKKIKNCGTCGTRMIQIRGKFHNEPKRIICATCAYERLEHINEISSRNYESISNIQESFKKYGVKQ